MSQHDLTIDNQGFPAFRADLNNALQALGSTQSGTTAPSPTFANQLWYDTTNNQLKIRNEDNDAWISIVTLDQSGDVVSAITATTLNGTTVNAGTLNATGVTTVQAGTVSLPAITTTGDTNTGIFFPAADQVAIATNGVERVNLGNSATVFNDGGADVDFRVEGDTNQNLLFVDASTDRIGINKSSPDTKLNIGFTGADAVNTFRIEGSNGSSERYAFDIQADGENSATKFLIGSGGGAPTERMRIDTSGNVLVNRTSNTAGTKLNVFGVNVIIAETSTATGTCYQGTYSNTTGLVYFGNWSYNGSNVGSITSTGSNTSYVTSSDYRLKENIAPMTGALATISALKPVTYKWKVDGSDGQGFIAHELQAVVPDCVSGEKDAVNADGSIKPQGVDTSFLVATLTAAIQELKAEFDAYKATHP
jgi:hypothetical protein